MLFIAADRGGPIPRIRVRSTALDPAPADRHRRNACQGRSSPMRRACASAIRFASQASRSERCPGRAAEGGEAVVVTMALAGGDGATVPRSDARASIWWRTLLGGNTFVDLDLGSPSAEPLGERTISISRTQSQIEFDQLLEPVDSDGRQGLRATIAAFDEGFENTRALKRTVAGLAPSMRQLGPAVSAARGLEEGDLTTTDRRARARRWAASRAPKPTSPAWSRTPTPRWPLSRPGDRTSVDSSARRRRRSPTRKRR